MSKEIDFALLKRRSQIRDGFWNITAALKSKFAADIVSDRIFRHEAAQNCARRYEIASPRISVRCRTNLSR